MDYNCDSYIIQSMIIYKIVKTFVGLNNFINNQIGRAHV